MKNLIKLVILLVILAVFAFSSNPHIVKARTFAVNKGKVLFDKGVNEMKISDNETLSKIAKEIE